jgi:hypothetical protein
MRKGTMTMDFLMVVGGLIILVVLGASAWGEGVMADAISGLISLKPGFISEEVATYITAVSAIPAEVVETQVEIGAERNVMLQPSGGGYNVFVEDARWFAPFFSELNVEPLNVKIEFQPKQVLLIVKDSGTLAIEKTGGLG